MIQALVTREKGHELRSVPGLSHPASRKLRGELLLQIIIHPTRTRRSRVDGVYGDALVPDLGGEGTGKSLDRPLRRDVDELPHHRPERLAAREVDYPTPAPRLEFSGETDGEERRGPQVNRVVDVQDGGVELLVAFAGRVSRVIHEDRRWPEPLRDGLQEFFRGIGPRKVGLHALGADAHAAQFL